MRNVFQMITGAPILTTTYDGVTPGSHLVDPAAVGGPMDNAIEYPALCGELVKAGNLRFGTVAENPAVIDLERGYMIVLEAAVSCPNCQALYRDREYLK